jgi:hypothetical protein
MIPLAILGLILLAIWGFGIWWRDSRAAFMADWVHVPLVAAIVVLLMSVGLLIQDLA